MISPPAGRDDRIDALRGLALLGILLVNIQSFVWGGANPAGYLQEGSTALDRALWRIEKLTDYSRLIIELDAAEHGAARGPGWDVEFERLWAQYERAAALLPDSLDAPASRQELAAIKRELESGSPLPRG